MTAMLHFSVYAFTIAENGVSKAVIMIDKDAPEPEIHAANELKDFLFQITGAKIDIIYQQIQKNSSEQSCQKNRILVGSSAAKLALPDFTADGLGDEGIAIISKGNNLILTGAYPRGTLYAVYTFLEDYAGCRWWSSKVSFIPKKPTLKISDEINIRYKPVFEYRESFWFDAFDGDWAVRNKCNGGSYCLDAKRGGKKIFEGEGHSFYSLIPPETYFKDHPEWFSQIEGKRTHFKAQLCLTNEAMKDELVNCLKLRLNKNPDASIAWVSQNDCFGYCQCDKCNTLNNKEESPAGSLIYFVNSVDQDIEKEFPNVAISTLAYRYTRKPPKYLKPRHNVIIYLSSFEASFSKPFSDDRNRRFRDDLIAWSNICQRLYVWDYVSNFSNYILPHPNLRVLGPNIKFLADHHVKGVFSQGAYTTNGAEMAELRSWVIAKLLWNPYLDAQELIKEFIYGYYGNAGEYILAYLNLIHDSVEASRDWLGCFSQPKAKFLSFDLLYKSWIYLKKAEDAVKDNPDLRLRVQVAQLPVIYAVMMKWNQMREKAEATGVDWFLSDSIETVFKHFLNIAKADNITRLNEWKEGFGILEKVVKNVKNYKCRLKIMN